ncbi:hypothetical protein GTW51_10070 [Aurantimonas aggregata]|uniref:Uncharacterized protein n=1 Tax=Aurantimonas aggregata TaxID=2047720 RepID=A0A6L9MGX8_9HYPH|nr:hypothetical protein [Aurantimonas aggregata]NDV87047.1 hypothetical protein [Aurantimonas aggregata]
MGDVAAKLFGGGGGDEAKKQAAEQRQLQSIANDRQLAALNEDSKASGASRRAPRGRRLLLSDTAEGGLASTLGG